MTTATTIDISKASRHEAMVANLVTCGMTADQAQAYMRTAYGSDSPAYDTVVTELDRALEEVVNAQYELICVGRRITRAIEQVGALLARCGNPNPLGELQRDPAEFDHLCSRVTYGRARLVPWIQLYLKRK